MAGAGVASDAEAQEVAADSVMQHVKGNRLSLGGYGEVALSRMFYSVSCACYDSRYSCGIGCLLLYYISLGKLIILEDLSLIVALYHPLDGTARRSSCR